MMDDHQTSLGVNIAVASTFGSLSLPGMLPFTSLLPHQVTGIDKIREVFLNRLTRGVVLGDSSGLGKSITAAGFLHYRIHEIKDDPTQAIYANKPWLVVTPSHSIKQLAADLTRYAPNVLIYVYSKDPIEGYPHISELGVHHNIFKSKDAFKFVVLTSSLTLISEHGPDKYLEWVCDKSGNSQTMDSTEEDVNAYDGLISPKWPQSLYGLFEGVVVKEAQAVQDPDSKYNQTLFYLNPKFYLLLASASIASDMDAMEGYLRLLQLVEVREFVSHKDENSIVSKLNFWNPKTLEQYGFDANINPFELEDAHPLVALRYSLSTWEKVIKQSKACVVREQYTRQVLNHLIIHRNYESPVPGNESETIAQGLPAISKRTVPLGFGKGENNELRKKCEVLFDKLYGPEFDSTGDLCRNSDVERKLQLVSIWLDFDIIESEMDTGQLEKHLADEDYLHWMVSRVAEKLPLRYSASIPKDEKRKLATEILKSSPKLLVLITILSEEVFVQSKNIIVWCDSRHTLLLTTHILSALDYTIMTLTNDMNTGEIYDLQDNFNQLTSVPAHAVVMMATYDMATLGLNLRDACYHQIFLDRPPNHETSVQAINFVRRLGRPNSLVHIDEVVLGDGFEDMVNQELMSRTGI